MSVSVSKRVLIVSLCCVAVVASCKLGEVSCSNGECIATDKYCNGLPDCQDGTDELPHCSPCNITYYGKVGRTYELEVKRPKEHQMPFLCHLNFTAGGGNFGELVQLTFESFSVGTFESFTNEGCPDGYISIKEGNRPASGGKWCGSAWGYTVYYSETSNINVTLKLDKLPPQHDSGYSFEFRLSYKYLRVSDARIRYGNGTQKSYRGKLHTGTYCDRLLEGCGRRSCRIQSPNYPGIYPRNVTCHYRVRERNIPEGKHALIAVRQANYHQKELLQLPTKFDENKPSQFRLWDKCNMMQDYVEIFDGWDDGSSTLAHLCSGEVVPEIISSGPELMVKFHTSPFGNPFHPLPLSYLPGFELEIQIYYVDKQSPTYIEHGKKCEFILTTFDGSSGLLESPHHSLPPNTTCHYHFRGHHHEIVWISFIKYHVAEYDRTGDCDVQLQLWDGDHRPDATSPPPPLIGRFCRDDKPKLCDHTLLGNSSRLTRPCALSESYVSSGSDLTITHSIRYGNVLYPVSFILRYEFVDLKQDGSQLSMNPCDRLFKGNSGKFSSPKITFLYGRGGQKNLNCAYHFESAEYSKLKLSFGKASFSSRCSTVFVRETGRYECRYSVFDRTAQLTVVEYPWPGIATARHCFCESFNTDNPITVVTKTARKVVVNFLVTNMNITEDYRDFSFEGSYEFLSGSSGLEGCSNNVWRNRRMKGSSGEISLKNNVQTLKQGDQTYYYFNQTTLACLEQPWLIEPEDSYTNFIYLKVTGQEIKNSSQCPTKNRIVVYPAESSSYPRVICPSFYDSVVELFSDGWGTFSSKNIQPKNVRSFVVEFVQKEQGNFAVNWMEIARNPKLLLPASLLLINGPTECPHSCPELGACISADLWCDGLRHCPSGNDEQESNCSMRTTFPVTLITSAALIAVVLVVVILATAVTVYLWKHCRKERKNVIVSVTEHTFLEFKSGLC